MFMGHSKDWSPLAFCSTVTALVNQITVHLYVSISWLFRKVTAVLSPLEQN